MAPPAVQSATKEGGHARVCGAACEQAGSWVGRTDEREMLQGRFRGEAVPPRIAYKSWLKGRPLPFSGGQGLTEFSLPVFRSMQGTPPPPHARPGPP